MKKLVKKSLTIAAMTIVSIQFVNAQTWNIPPNTGGTSNTYLGTTAGDLILKTPVSPATNNVLIQTAAASGNTTSSAGNSIFLNTNGSTTTPNLQINNSGQVGIGMVPLGNTPSGGSNYLNGPTLQVYGITNHHVPTFAPADVMRINGSNGKTLGISSNYISTGTSALTLNGSVVYIPKLIVGEAAAFSSNTPVTTTPGTYDIYSGNGILAGKVKVAVLNSTNWSDFVFDKNYKLRSLSEVEKYIKKNKHLPDVPSAEEVVKEGINLGEMDAKLLQKIEELTLYMIEMKKENERIIKSNNELKKEVELLKKK